MDDNVVFAARSLGGQADQEVEMIKEAVHDGGEVRLAENHRCYRLEKLVAERTVSSGIAQFRRMEPFVEKVGALGEVVNLLVSWKSIPFLQIFEVDTSVNILRVSTVVNVS